MICIIAKIINTMQFIYIGWNCFWWNYHVGITRHHESRNIWDGYWFNYHISRARVADFRIATLDADWRKN